MPELGLKIVLVDIRSQFDLLDRDTRLFLARLPGLLILFEAVFAPVHDSNDDGARVCGDLHQVETLVLGGSTGFVQRDDPQLFTIGVDESDGG